MDQKVIQILLILLFHLEIPSAAEVKAEEGEQVTIKCKPPKGGTIEFIFRVVDELGMEFIGSFSPSGSLKVQGPNYNKNPTVTKTGDSYDILVKSFNKREDSGMYSCASLIKGNNLTFGPVTLLRETDKATQKLPTNEVPTTRQTSTTPTSCLCTEKNKSGPSMSCAPIILGPLAGGCGLLLLLLITTILYCNKIRTRRCPHHHKRKLRTMVPEKQMMTNRHI